MKKEKVLIKRLLKPRKMLTKTRRQKRRRLTKPKRMVKIRQRPRKKRARKPRKMRRIRPPPLLSKKHQRNLPQPQPPPR